MTGKKILFLPISGRNCASARYRVFQCVPYLEEAGFKVRVMTPPDKKGWGLGRILQSLRDERSCLDAAREADLVFIQKRLFKKGFARKLKALGKTVVFDFDDNIYTSPSGSWSLLTRMKVEGRIRDVLGMSSLVLAGNGFLAGKAMAAGTTRVEVLPTGIDVRKYKLKAHKQGGPVVLGWMGSSVNHPYLDLLRGPLQRLAARTPGISLMVISDTDYHMDGVKVVNRRWAEDTEIADLLDMDIGLMPLVDDGWTRGKCALKALQYMACGIPAVCSPVGAANEVIDNGVDGCLPHGDAACQNMLAELIVSHEKRAVMGMAGRKKVEDKYSMDALGPRLVSLLESLQEGRQP